MTIQSLLFNSMKGVKSQQKLYKAAPCFIPPKKGLDDFFVWKIKIFSDMRGES